MVQMGMISLKNIGQQINDGHLFFFGAGERGIMENILISSEMYELFMNCIKLSQKYQ
jgi:hypothetical protein